MNGVLSSCILTRLQVEAFELVFPEDTPRGWLDDLRRAVPAGFLEERASGTVYVSARCAPELEERLRGYDLPDFQWGPLKYHAERERARRRLEAERLPLAALPIA